MDGDLKVTADTSTKEQSSESRELRQYLLPSHKLEHSKKARFYVRFSRGDDDVRSCGLEAFLTPTHQGGVSDAIVQLPCPLSTAVGEEITYVSDDTGFKCR